MITSDITNEAMSQSPLPHDILIVEDDFIIALDLEDILRGLGVANVRTANNVTHALAAITAATPQFGLIDVNLGGEKSFPVAERLIELGVPFVFTTGYGDNFAFPPHLANARMVTKPYSVEAIRAAIFV
ncbi:response regulator [Hyphomicrobium sp. CS1GBMeth3]|uniref:response regulator n=1 Tax=Hyphomicrobium sp. CS1GBMeth3 TaxID=1892845 RepID=UPI00093122B5|nr:response regulator [Hyphomicrobium sp. CS1GBMeth3]